MLTIILDTNVLISALVFGGKPKMILEAAIQGTLQMALSQPISDELEGVLAGEKFRYPNKVTRVILDELIAISHVVTPAKRVNIIQSDPADNRILECAVAADAEIIVSGDTDLLTLKEFSGIAILSPAEFVEKHLK